MGLNSHTLSVISIACREMSAREFSAVLYNLSLRDGSNNEEQELVSNFCTELLVPSVNQFNRSKLTYWIGTSPFSEILKPFYSENKDIWPPQLLGDHELVSKKLAELQDSNFYDYLQTIESGDCLAIANTFKIVNSIGPEREIVSNFLLAVLKSISKQDQDWKKDRNSEPMKAIRKGMANSQKPRITNVPYESLNCGAFFAYDCSSLLEACQAVSFLLKDRENEQFTPALLNFLYGIKEMEVAYNCLFLAIKEWVENPDKESDIPDLCSLALFQDKTIATNYLASEESKRPEVQTALMLSVDREDYGQGSLKFMPELATSLANNKNADPLSRALALEVQNVCYISNRESLISFRNCPSYFKGIAAASWILRLSMEERVCHKLWQDVENEPQNLQSRYYLVAAKELSEALPPPFFSDNKNHLITSLLALKFKKATL